MKENLGTVIKLLTIVYLLFFLLGGIVVLRYCLNIGYYSSGVDIFIALF